GMIRLHAPWISPQSSTEVRHSCSVDSSSWFCATARAVQPADSDAARFLYAGSASATSRAAIGCHIASDQAACDCCSSRSAARQPVKIAAAVDNTEAERRILLASQDIETSAGRGT